jgi:hypothetical protein
VSVISWSGRASPFTFRKHTHKTSGSHQTGHLHYRHPPSTRLVTRYEIDIPPASLRAALGVALQAGLPEPNTRRRQRKWTCLIKTSGGGMDSNSKTGKFLNLMPKRTGAV